MCVRTCGFLTVRVNLCVCVCVNFNVCKTAITEIADLSFRISTFMLHEFVLLIATMKYFV
jgi:hypothetical protein